MQLDDDSVGFLQQARSPVACQFLPDLCRCYARPAAGCRASGNLPLPPGGDRVLKPRHADDYDAAITERCERVLVTVLVTLARGAIASFLLAVWSPAI